MTTIKKVIHVLFISSIIIMFFSIIGYTKTSLHDKLVGNWEVDIEETKNQNPEEDLNNPPIKSMLSSMKVEFKKDIQTVTIEEKKIKDNSYKVIKQEGDMLVIDLDGEKTSIQFLNDDKINLMGNGEDMDIIFNRQ